MNRNAAEQDLKAALDRIDTALARIARAGQPLAADQAGDHAADQAAALPPAWAHDVADRLDALIGELRRALSGEQT